MTFGRNYHDLRYVAWRKMIRQRDNSTCQFPGCNIRKKIQVHHIRTWRDYPSLRFDVNNGICLCKKCHAKIKSHETLYAPMFLDLIMQKLKGK